MSHTNDEPLVRWKCNYKRCATGTGTKTKKSYCTGKYGVEHFCVNGKLVSLIPFKDILNDGWAFEFTSCNQVAFNIMPHSIQQHMNKEMIEDSHEQEEKEEQLHNNIMDICEECSSSDSDNGNYNKNKSNNNNNNNNNNIKTRP
eukprot:2206_1